MPTLHIISTSPRPHSNSLRIAHAYAEIAATLGLDTEIIDLHTLPADTWTACISGNSSQSPDFQNFIHNHIKPIRYAIWILPEYNGSIPGIVKVLIDCSDIKSCFIHTHNLLVGVATGRAGNVRGLDHFLTILQHLQAQVFWDKLPISQVHTLLDNDTLQHQPTRDRIEVQLRAFVQSLPLEVQPIQSE